MGIDEQLRIDRIQQQDGTSGSSANAPTDPAKFQQLLDQLRKVKPTESPGAATDLTELGDEVRKADSDFQTLMELRRMLEQAYRRHQ